MIEFGTHVIQPGVALVCRLRKSLTSSHFPPVLHRVLERNIPDLVVHARDVAEELRRGVVDCEAPFERHETPCRELEYGEEVRELVERFG